MLGLSLSSIAANNDRKASTILAYIVYMGSLPEVEYFPTSNPHRTLQQVIKESSVADSLIRSYKKSFDGFAAKLTNEEVRKLASMKEVVSIFPNRILHLHTTRSWDFMGFNNSVRHNPIIERNVIIGVIDTGIWPESPSFSDEGFGPAPKKWKGACWGGKNVTCNNKIIGARFYQSSQLILEGSARDETGHGSHTASTAAGNEVKDDSFFGLAQGTARGGVPSARIAAYNVCGPNGRLSLGHSVSVEFVDDVIAIGSFHAMEKGILTLHAAGNNGAAGVYGVSSVAPWMLSVAASTIDRKFIDKVVLGNNKTLNGLSVNPFTSKGTKLPIVYGREVSRSCPEFYAGMCNGSCVDSNLVKGKIILCDRFLGSLAADNAGAAGSIVLSDHYDNVSFVMALPAVALNKRNYILVKSYVNSTNVLHSGQPDITAPGVDILAAYSEIAPPTWPMDKSKNPNGEISYGAGHINPIKAINPGLVYEALKEDYIKLMCSLGYSHDSIKLVSGDNSSCPKSSEDVPPIKLNYPSLTFRVPTNQSFTVTFHRTVKNVGLANSTYKAEVSSNPKLKVKVIPDVLSFKALEEKKSFNVTVSGEGLKDEFMLSATLIWSDGTHIVRSPIVVHAYPNRSPNV
ncbi:hypothetical protein CRYUN_Cryun03dG0155000 [Craigia yunnanensis]